jgi:hypothetical protein
LKRNGDCHLNIYHHLEVIVLVNLTFLEPPLDWISMA